MINYLDALQREEKTRAPNHENSKAIAYFIEEAQNAFSSRNSASAENETFLTVFNEARNNREGFFTSSQRLTNFSKTIRSKQIQCIGKLASEDITPALRRLEKAHGLDFSNMKPRTWFYEGSTFTSPEFKQQGKPYIVNAEIKQEWLNSLPKPKTLLQKINAWFNFHIVDEKTAFQAKTNSNSEERELSEDSKEDSELDGLMSEGDLFFPEEF